MAIAYNEKKNSVTVFKVDGQEFHTHSAKHPAEICKILKLSKKLTEYERGFLDDLMQMVKTTKGC